MFDILLGSKFSNKCKSKLKGINTRTGPIKSKKQTVVKIQRKDVADILAAGKQEQAITRIDGLSTDMNLVDCYEMIEKYCEFIQSQLPILQKQRECPDEVAEAMSTLIYAAARFRDLPELCDLRRIFIERYGSNIELYANSEFMKKYQKKHLSKEEKLQIMQEIAKEFSVKWNMKEFDQKSHNFPVPKADQMQKSFPLHTKIEEPLPVPSILKREVQPMPKDELNTVNKIKQVQVQVDVHEVSNVDPKHLTEPARHVERYPAKAAIPPYTKASSKQKTSGHEQDSTGLEQVKYQLKSSSDKPVNLVPPYTKPDVPRYRYHIEETWDGDIDHYYSRQKYDTEKKIRDGDTKEEVRVLHNKGKATNMIPPYVKQRNSDQLRNTELEAPVEDRPKSMRTVQKPTVTNTNNNHVFDDQFTDHRSIQRGGYNDRERKEKIVVKQTSKKSEHGEDNAIHYGRLLSQISSEQRRYGEYDEHEIAMNRLQAHYSSKVTNRVPRNDRTSAKNSTPNNVYIYPDGVADYKHEVRTASVPFAPATKLDLDKLTALVASKQPDYRGNLQTGVAKY